MSNYSFKSKVGQQLATNMDVHGIPTFKSVTRNTICTLATQKAVPWILNDTRSLE